MTRKFLIYSFPFFILFVALSLFEPWLYRNLFSSTSIDNLKGREFQIIAHKGASGLAPENTLLAFKKAIELGADQVELDARHTKDGKVVVFHDQRLDRVAKDSLGNQVTGDIHDYTLEELNQFEVGSWFDSKFKGEKIPTLQEVLDLVDGRCKVMIEIKHMDHPLYHDFAERLVKIIRSEKNGYDWVILQSYENKYLKEVHELDSLVQTKVLIIGEDSAPLIAFYIETRVHLGRAKKDNRPNAINPEWTTLSPRRVFRMHARGYDVYAYPVNEREDMIKMLNAGVDGIITDYPDRLIKLKKEIQSLK